MNAVISIVLSQKTHAHPLRFTDHSAIAVKALTGSSAGLAVGRALAVVSRFANSLVSGPVRPFACQLLEATSEQMATNVQTHSGVTHGLAHGLQTASDESSVQNLAKRDSA